MKNLVFIVSVFIVLLSCEKVNENPDKLDIDFNHKILDGYFVKSIAFDHDGNTWIGTFKQGLIKYNSNETIVYNSGNSIIFDSSVIYDIAVDSKNNVWISCEGIVKYDGANFTQYNSSNTMIPEDFVASIAIDSKDNIWFTSSRYQQGGIVKYDGSSWTVFTPENSGLPDNFVKSIAIDKRDNVWLALNGKVNDSYLVRLSNDKWTIYTSSDLGFTPYYFGNIVINNQNKLCGSIDYSLSSTISNHGPQVFIFDGVRSEKIYYDSVSNIKFISVDDQDNIWSAFYGGYAVYIGLEWENDDTSFNEEGIFAIEQSLDEKIWIGTGDGIYIQD